MCKVIWKEAWPILQSEFSSRKNGGIWGISKPTMEHAFRGHLKSRPEKNRTVNMEDFDRFSCQAPPFVGSTNFPLVICPWVVYMGIVEGLETTDTMNMSNSVCQTMYWSYVEHANCK